MYAITRPTVTGAVTLYDLCGSERSRVLNMGKFERYERVGLRDKETNALIAVYPKKPEGPDDKIEEDVKYWYYQQSCSAEEELKGLFVDQLTEHELKSAQGK